MNQAQYIHLYLEIKVKLLMPVMEQLEFEQYKMLVLWI